MTVAQKSGRLTMLETVRFRPASSGEVFGRERDKGCVAQTYVPKGTTPQVKRTNLAWLTLLVGAVSVSAWLFGPGQPKALSRPPIREITTPDEERAWDIHEV